MEAGSWRRHDVSTRGITLLRGTRNVDYAESLCEYRRSIRFLVESYYSQVMNEIPVCWRVIHIQKRIWVLWQDNGNLMRGLSNRKMFSTLVWSSMLLVLLSFHRPMIDLDTGRSCHACLTEISVPVPSQNRNPNNYRGILKFIDVRGCWRSSSPVLSSSRRIIFDHERQRYVVFVLQYTKATCHCYQNQNGWVFVVKTFLMATTRPISDCPVRQGRWHSNAASQGKKSHPDWKSKLSSCCSPLSSTTISRGIWKVCDEHDFFYSNSRTHTSSRSLGAYKCAVFHPLFTQILRCHRLSQLSSRDTNLTGGTCNSL